jgi:hypothetical protein
MKRKLKWLAIVLAVSLLGFGTALWLWPRDRITAESRQKIRIGMTEDEVVEILGGPGMNHEEYLHHRRDFEIEGPELDEPEWGVPDWEMGKTWIGRRGLIRINLDQENRVSWKGFDGVRWNNGSILDRLRDWLGW